MLRLLSWQQRWLGEQPCRRAPALAWVLCLLRSLLRWLGLQRRVQGSLALRVMLLLLPPPAMWTWMGAQARVLRGAGLVRGWEVQRRRLLMR